MKKIFIPVLIISFLSCAIFLTPRNVTAQIEVSSTQFWKQMKEVMPLAKDVFRVQKEEFPEIAEDDENQDFKYPKTVNKINQLEQLINKLKAANYASFVSPQVNEKIGLFLGAISEYAKANKAFLLLNFDRKENSLKTKKNLKAAMDHWKQIKELEGIDSF